MRATSDAEKTRGTPGLVRTLRSMEARVRHASTGSKRFGLIRIAAMMVDRDPLSLRPRGPRPHALCDLPAVRRRVERVGAARPRAPLAAPAVGARRPPAPGGLRPRAVHAALARRPRLRARLPGAAADHAAVGLRVRARARARPLP